MAQQVCWSKHSIARVSGGTLTSLPTVLRRVPSESQSDANSCTRETHEAAQRGDATDLGGSVRAEHRQRLLPRWHHDIQQVSEPRRRRLRMRRHDCCETTRSVSDRPDASDRGGNLRCRSPRQASAAACLGSDASPAPNTLSRQLAPSSLLHHAAMLTKRRHHVCTIHHAYMPLSCPHHAPIMPPSCMHHSSITPRRRTRMKGLAA
eukprot:3458861-Rhodomonas_salina.4